MEDHRDPDPRPPLRPYQEHAIDAALKRSNLLLALVQGAGKQQPVSEPVLTPSGWVPIGDLQVGDLVCGPDGNARAVIGVHPQTTRTTYKVTFTDGSWTRCGPEHLWSVARQSRGRRRHELVTLSTQEIMQIGLHNGHGHEFWVPMTQPVSLVREQPLPVDPYTLGVILGDGHVKPGGHVEVTSDESILEAIGCSTGWEHVSPGVRSAMVPMMHEPMRELGLAGKRSWEKFIPERYLRAGVADRLALLQGLCDTDGSPTRNRVEYSTSSLDLAEGVRALVESLGGTAKTVSRVPKYTYLGEKRTGRVSYRVHIHLPNEIPPFRLQRKLEKLAPSTKYFPRRAMVEIVEVEPEDSVCISVDASDGLYLTRHCIVTHNTRTAIEIVRTLADEGTVSSGAIFCPATLKYQWRNSELAKWDDPELAQVIGGTKAKRTTQYLNAHTYRYNILSYDLLIHDWDLIKSHLPTDFLVLDEATYIKGLTSKRSKRAKVLARKSKFRYALSGQPVENRPEELFSIMEFVDPTVLGPFHRFDRTFILRNHWGKPERYRNLGQLHAALGEAMFRRSRDDIAEFLPERIEQVIPIPLNPGVQKVYDRIVADLREVLDQAVEAGMGSSFNLLAHYGMSDGNDQANWYKGQIMARITAMRLLCSDPFLLMASAQDFEDEETSSGSAYASQLLQDDKIAAGFDMLESSKMEALVEQVTSVLDADPDNRVVIFTSFRPMVGRIAQEFPKFPVATMTGDTAPAKRQERIEQFNAGKVRIFVSSDAGAYGVKLDTGTHLYCYDLPWSAGALQQRVARIDRTSTKHATIEITYLYTAGTIEERQYHMLREKAAIAEAFVDGKGFDARGSLTLTLSSLREFL